MEDIIHSTHAADFFNYEFQMPKFGILHSEFGIVPRLLFPIKGVIRGIRSFYSGRVIGYKIQKYGF